MQTINLKSKLAPKPPLQIINVLVTDIEPAAKVKAAMNEVGEGARAPGCPPGCQCCWACVSQKHGMCASHQCWVAAHPVTTAHSGACSPPPWHTSCSVQINAAQRLRLAAYEQSEADKASG